MTPPDCTCGGVIKRQELAASTSSPAKDWRNSPGHTPGRHSFPHSSGRGL